MCNAGVLQGPHVAAGPQQPAWFNLGRWGKLVNILALVYGGLMVINIALWADTGLFGDCGDGWAPVLEPDDQHVHQAVRTGDRRAAGLARLRDARRRRSSSSGALYYAVAVRGKAHDVESADAVTGEAVIG